MKKSTKNYHKMKIHILFKFQDAPYGGGNQFLKALKKQFEKEKRYEKNISRADVILFNSFQQMDKVIIYRWLFPKKIFVHRVDGPISLYRGKDDRIDELIYYLNQTVADGTVFQSDWSKNRNRELGMKTVNGAVIVNATDKDLFNTKNRILFSPKRKTRLMMSSWSDNWHKGFKFYQFLDKHLNLQRYEAVFVGRSPVNFLNIMMLSPMGSAALAAQLKKSDIYLTASENDPCSNSLIEALQCGLPAAYLKSGGHSEIVRRGGEGYSSGKEMLRSIDKIADNWSYYHDNIDVKSIENISREYLNYFQKISTRRKSISFAKHTMSLLFFIINILYGKIYAKKRN